MSPGNEEALEAGHPYLTLYRNLSIFSYLSIYLYIFKYLITLDLVVSNHPLVSELG